MGEILTIVKKKLLLDAVFVVASIIASLLLTQFDIANYVLSIPPEYELVAIFITGLCFVSVFTIAPAIVVFGQLALQSDLVTLVVVGAFGALIMDLLIFTFFRKRISADAKSLCSIDGSGRFAWLCRLHISRWILALIGGLIIASPFPDEIGLAMMGMGSVKKRMFIPISFVMNALGIYLIALVALSI